MDLFRKLSSAEEAEFRKWARDNYKPQSPIFGLWHPVTQDECVKINAERLEGGLPVAASSAKVAAEGE